MAKIAIATATIISSFRFVFSQFTSSSMFHSFSRLKMNSTNWPAPNLWVFLAQLVEQCSANAEAMCSRPVQVATFFQVNLQLLKLQLPLRRWYLHLNLHFRSSHHLYSSKRINEQDKFLSLFEVIIKTWSPYDWYDSLDRCLRLF